MLALGGRGRETPATLKPLFNKSYRTVEEKKDNFIAACPSPPLTFFVGNQGSPSLCKFHSEENLLHGENDAPCHCGNFLVDFSVLTARCMNVFEKVFCDHFFGSP